MFQPKFTSKPSQQIRYSRFCLPHPLPLSPVSFVKSTTCKNAETTTGHSLPISCRSSHSAVTIYARPNGQGGDDSILWYTFSHGIKDKLPQVDMF